jgi:hypothetical protein
LTDPDHGEALVFEICRSFTGVPLDRLEVQGVDFWLNDDEAIYSRKPAAVRLAAAVFATASSRPWWKFWG